MVAAFVVGCGLDAVDGRALWVLAETQVIDETQEWVSDDAEPCMEDRVQGIEQALQQAVQQLAAMQVQQAQTEQQLREAREAATTATAAAAAAGKGVRAGKGGVAGGASGGGPHGFGIDTRMLGRPDTFDGSESK